MFPFKDPRIDGIKEQLLRAQRFINNAKRSKKLETKFRNFIAAIYPARAVAELIFECADKEIIDQSREQLKELMELEVPYFLLVEKIRIHDFHRFGCLPPDPNYKMLMVGGPIKLKASSGQAQIQLDHKSESINTTGSSKVEMQRPLYNSDGRFFDDNSKEYINLDEILIEHVNALPNIINKFEAMIKANK